MGSRLNCKYVYAKKQRIVTTKIAENISRKGDKRCQITLNSAQERITQNWKN
jgi:hypothetical protein